jgi:hypothetical protein
MTCGEKLNDMLNNMFLYSNYYIHQYGVFAHTFMWSKFTVYEGIHTENLHHQHWFHVAILFTNPNMVQFVDCSEILKNGHNIENSHENP